MSDYLGGSELWQRVQNVTGSALASGALQRIPTQMRLVRDQRDGTPVDFQVRIVENLARKSREQRDRIAQRKNPRGFDPFMPHDPALYVGELSSHYRCLLNKFNVVDHHILMVTSRFSTQRSPLDREDFLAAALCLQARDGLVFYNGGSVAGASVEHKHLQMVPLPLSPSKSFPLADWLSPRQRRLSKVTAGTLPFPHRVSGATFEERANVEKVMDSAGKNLATYQRMLGELRIARGPEGLVSPHNMLMTRDLMWVVPRHRESFRGFPVNALGYAGTFLAANEAQLRQLEAIGCLALLQAVANSNFPPDRE